MILFIAGVVLVILLKILLLLELLLIYPRESNASLSDIWSYGENALMKSLS